MPSKIEKLIAEFPHQRRGMKGAGFGGSIKLICTENCRTCALERAYLEEVLPVVNALLAAKAELHYAHPVVYEIVAEALRPFDAPAPEEPKQ